MNAVIRIQSVTQLDYRIKHSIQRYSLYTLFTLGNDAFYRHTDVKVNGTPIWEQVSSGS